MKYATIKPTDVANGPGVRVSLFVSGCTHYCEGCFNSEAWDFQYGEEFTEETIETILNYLIMIISLDSPCLGENLCTPIIRNL